jgi:hypothetical protein
MLSTTKRDETTVFLKSYRCRAAGLASGESSPVVNAFAAFSFLRRSHPAFHIRPVMPSTMQVNPMTSRIIASVSVWTIGPTWYPLVSTRCELDDAERPRWARLTEPSQAGCSGLTAIAARGPPVTIRAFIARSHCIPIAELLPPIRAKAARSNGHIRSQ